MKTFLPGPLFPKLSEESCGICQQCLKNQAGRKQRKPGPLTAIAHFAPIHNTAARFGRILTLLVETRTPNLPIRNRPPGTATFLPDFTPSNSRVMTISTLDGFVTGMRKGPTRSNPAPRGREFFVGCAPHATYVVAEQQPNHNEKWQVTHAVKIHGLQAGLQASPGLERGDRTCRIRGGAALYLIHCLPVAFFTKNGYEARRKHQVDTS